MTSLNRAAVLSWFGCAWSPVLPVRRGDIPRGQGRDRVQEIRQAAFQRLDNQRGTSASSGRMNLRSKVSLEDWSREGCAMGSANRREFLGATGTVVLGCAAGSANDSSPAAEKPPRSLPPRPLLKGAAAPCRPESRAIATGFPPWPGPTGRMAAYPLDSLDFIMIDLERPEGSSRHASWCTGDLTGRLLEFLSVSEGVDGKSDPSARRVV